MTAISAKAVMDLREKTGVSMMACKKALIEANGNEEEAVKILRKSGAAKADAKAARATAEGAVLAQGKAIVKINCETDFVAKNDDFQSFLKELAAVADSSGAEATEKLFEEKKTDLVARLGENITFGGVKTIDKGSVKASFAHFNNKITAIVALDSGSEELARDIAMHVVATNPLVLSPTEVDDALVEKEKEIWIAELKESGKPEQIWDKIMQGKEAKFRGANALLSQPFVKNPDLTIEKHIAQEGGEIAGFIRMEV